MMKLSICTLFLVVLVVSGGGDGGVAGNCNVDGIGNGGANEKETADGCVDENKNYHPFKVAANILCTDGCTKTVGIGPDGDIRVTDNRNVDGTEFPVCIRGLGRHLVRVNPKIGGLDFDKEQDEGKPTLQSGSLLRFLLGSDRPVDCSKSGLKKLLDCLLEDLLEITDRVNRYDGADTGHEHWEDGYGATDTGGERRYRHDIEKEGCRRRHWKRENETADGCVDESYNYDPFVIAVNLLCIGGFTKTIGIAPDGGLRITDYTDLGGYGFHVCVEALGPHLVGVNASVGNVGFNKEQDDGLLVLGSRGGLLGGGKGGGLLGGLLGGGKGGGLLGGLLGGGKGGGLLGGLLGGGKPVDCSKSGLKKLLDGLLEGLLGSRKDLEDGHKGIKVGGALGGRTTDSDGEDGGLLGELLGDDGGLLSRLLGGDGGLLGRLLGGDRGLLDGLLGGDGELLGGDGGGIEI